MSDINIGQLTEAINDKADRDLNNTNATLPGLNAVLPNDMDYVVESQEPTAENNYTWYRLYKSGWVQQGGRSLVNETAQQITLPKIMANTYYTVTSAMAARTNFSVQIISETVIELRTSSSTNYILHWRVSGYIAEE